MNKGRVWLFRGLVIIAAALLVFTFLQPWWHSYVNAGVGGDFNVSIYPYGLDDTEFVGFYTLMPEGGAEVAMPVWFTPVMWTYLGLVIAALLIGAFIKEKNINLFGRKFNLSRWLIGLVGFSYIVVVITAIIVISIRVSAMEIPLVGTAWVDLGTYALWELVMDIESEIKLGYWLACATGPLLIVLALFRNKIIGKSQTE